jgi:pimeloyl-ACP methyl ester carboxylesterase
MAPLARAIAQKGFRVLVHDRRNTGASQMHFEPTPDSEDEVWADDLHALLRQLGVQQAFLGGSSAGARLSLLTYRRHPAIVRGLLLMRVTGGEFAARRLPPIYYGQFIEAVRSGGMAAVAQTEVYRERLALNPANRDYLLSLDPQTYLDVMTRWMAHFVAGAAGPVMGVSADELAAVKVPALVVPGNDRTHSMAGGRAAARLIPGCTLCELPLDDQPVDLIPFPDWAPHYPFLAETFAAFMRDSAARG